jgi:hypothetical protein
MAAVEQLTFGNVPVAVQVAASPSGPGYEIERELAAAGASCVAGVDEVGRGAWAGPVTVCAVMVRPGFPAPPAGLTGPGYLRAGSAAECRDEASEANTTVEPR